MEQFNSIKQNINWWEKNREDMINLALGIAITIFVVWGIYIGINLHL